MMENLRGGAWVRGYAQSSPGSVAEMRDPKRREGIMVVENPPGMGLPVRLAKEEPLVSAPLRV